MVQGTVALRVDVCTRRGLDDGVPRLLELFRRADVRASFFVAMGPDRSGAALRRLVHTEFLRKMWRTNPLRLYGLRTLLSGTLLPARLVGAGVPERLRQIAAEGHEVAPHGWDHVRWQDRVARLPREAIRTELQRAAEAFAAALGCAPAASAAPGWRTTSAALAVQESLALRYASDTRAASPFRPMLPGGRPGTLQIPTTLPTLDEILGTTSDPAGALLAALRPGLNVLTAHAEVEGGVHAGVLERVLVGARAQGVRLVRLVDAAEAARDDPGTRLAPLGLGRVRGRGGWVAIPAGDAAACTVVTNGLEKVRDPAPRPAGGSHGVGAAAVAAGPGAGAHPGPWGRQ